MADGLNDARAMRVAEIMNDYRAIQLRISQYHVTPSASEYHEVGFGILRQCHAEAQAVLSIHFDPGALQAPTSPGDQTKRQLQRIILDASARRFRVQKIYLRTIAAIRWINTRRQILQGQQPQPVHTAALRQAENALRAELAAVTDARIVNELRAKDYQARHWLDEDPSVTSILGWIQSQ